MKELYLRAVSGVILGVMALSINFIGGNLFVLVWGVLSLLILQEWFSVTRSKSNFLIWLLLGVIYSISLFFSIITLRSSVNSFFAIISIFFLFSIVWGSDIVAYVVGRLLKGPKLAPKISPNKTWSGFLGGMVGGTLCGLLCLYFAKIEIVKEHFFLGMMISLSSIIGDLAESAFKRYFGVKDTGNLIPGHGGFMDRLDGFIIASIFAAAFGIIRFGVENAAQGLLYFV